MNRAVVIKYGDPQIASALEQAMTHIEHRPSLARQVRVAVGNTKTNEDYDQLILDAEHAYGRLARKPGPVRRTLLVAWAELWLAIRGYHDTLSEWNRG